MQTRGDKFINCTIGIERYSLEHANPFERVQIIGIVRRSVYDPLQINNVSNVYKKEIRYGKLAVRGNGKRERFTKV